MERTLENLEAINEQLSQRYEEVQQEKEALIIENHRLSKVQGYPMQPVSIDSRGSIRFEENPIISHLAREVSNLNDIAIWCAVNEVDAKYQEQLAQLIGYSVSGYGELSYVSDESFERAARLAEVTNADGKHREVA
ncbi:hypothetical protein [Halomonas sp. MS1]|nr:hypothetical protein [Halomonas sp. MS1]UTD55908.1 hypothetical protein NF683_01430 [Halomonas sp. MS1]